MFGYAGSMEYSDWNPTVFYFGEWWDAPAFDDAVKTDVPVGAECLWCQRAINEQDSGTFQLSLEHPDKPVVTRPVHIQCWVRSGLGSPAHLEGRCSCSGKEEPEDNRDYYDQGVECIRILKERRGIFSNVSP